MVHRNTQHLISRPYASAYDYPRDIRRDTERITRANISRIAKLLDGGESLNTILSLLEGAASNAAIKHIASHNKMIGPHREDFQARTNEIISSRRN